MGCCMAADRPTHRDGGFGSVLGRPERRARLLPWSRSLGSGNSTSRRRDSSHKPQIIRLPQAYLGISRGQHRLWPSTGETWIRHYWHVQSPLSRGRPGQRFGGGRIAASTWCFEFAELGPCSRFENVSGLLFGLVEVDIPDRQLGVNSGRAGLIIIGAPGAVLTPDTLIQRARAQQGLMARRPLSKTATQRSDCSGF